MVKSQKKYQLHNWLPKMLSNDEMIKENAYKRFLLDFKQKKTYLNGLLVKINNNYKLTFDHLTTEGQGENRIHSISRCQRIPWIKALIEYANTDKARYWIEKEDDIYVHYLALPDYSYLVVLKSNNKDTVGLSTAYYVDNESRDKLIEQFEKFKFKKNQMIRNDIQKAKLRNTLLFERCFSLKMTGCSEEDISEITKTPLNVVKGLLKRKF